MENKELIKSVTLNECGDIMPLDDSVISFLQILIPNPTASESKDNEPLSYKNCNSFELIYDNRHPQILYYLGDYMYDAESKPSRLLYNPISFEGTIESVLTEEYCRRNGYEVLCPHCKGSGTIYINEEIERLNNEWEPVDPPEGDGYQLWETTSEGSPASPVFATLEELCEWCGDNATTFGKSKATKEEWMQMLDNKFVYHQEGNLIFC